MVILKNGSEQAAISLAPIETDMTLDEFCETDLAVEVVSPSDIQYRVVEKAFVYLDAGTRLVWIVEPVGKTVTVYRSKTDIKTLTINDTLSGEDVVEGFTCQVAQLSE